MARHLERCAACREQMAAIEKTWQALEDDPDAPVTAEFRERTLALLEEEILRQRIRTFRPRPRLRWARVAAYAAGLALAALVGFSAARRLGAPAAGSSADSKQAPSSIEAGGRLSNVSYTPPDARGRIGVSFDLESRRSFVGRPDDPAMAKLLAYLVSRSAQTAGEKSQAIEQVSSHYGSRVAPTSPEIVNALTSTLRGTPTRACARRRPTRWRVSR